MGRVEDVSIGLANLLPRHEMRRGDWLWQVVPQGCRLHGRTNRIGDGGRERRHRWRVNTGDACNRIAELEVLLTGFSALTDGCIVIVACDVWLVVAIAAVRTIHPS